MENELDSIWKAAKNQFKKEMDPIFYETFFSGTRIKSVQGDTMTIEANSQLGSSLFQGDLSGLIDNVIRNVTGTNFKIAIALPGSMDSVASENLIKTQNKPVLFKDAHLDPHYTFENFVSGESDREALQAALYVSSKPGGVFNPLLIYGDSGLGKTHLLQAIGNSIAKSHPGLKVLYISANDFVEQFVTFVTGHQGSQTFSSYFREEVDVLLLDDIQFLRSKEKTMETFFNIFQILVPSNKQIVCTCDQDPRLIDGLDERLKTRFAKGLPVMVKKPDFETARNILLTKIHSMDLKNCAFDDDALDYIAAGFGDNVRELEGALNRLLFHTITFGPCSQVTLSIAKEALGDIQGAKRELAKPSVSRIVSVVADFYSLTPTQIMGKTRVQQIALARHISMYLCKTLLGMNYSEIGKAFGKDHTSAMSGISKVENMRETDPMARQSLDELKKRFVK